MPGTSPSYHVLPPQQASQKLMNRVAEVSENTVKITIKNPKDKSAEPHAIEIPAGFVLWSTGIGTSSFLLGLDLTSN